MNKRSNETDLSNSGTLANALRALSIDMIEKASSGHPGMPLGAADIMTALFTEAMTYNPNNPLWLNRDRFVLSAGHASAMLYAALHLSGYPITLEELKNFRQLGSVTTGHPEVNKDRGIECTTGPLGQGIGMAVGMAIAERKLASEYPGIIDHHTWVLTGEGCLMEGISHEACSLAGHLNLGKLILVFDNNSNTIDGQEEVSCSDNYALRFQSYGWETFCVDGHDHEALRKVFVTAKKSAKPSFIQCKTKIGKYSAFEDSHVAHGKVLGLELAGKTRQKLEMGDVPFRFPKNVTEMWKRFAAKSKEQYSSWETVYNSLTNAQKNAINGKINTVDHINEVISKIKADFRNEEKIATRIVSGKILESLVISFPELLGGSADLSGPTCTLTSNSVAITAETYSGNFIHYGIREHAMAAVMNGISLHSPYIPYGGTFFAFADYMKPAIRLSAMMQQKVIYVLTHDSVGIGEDGPTHQPIEHLNSYRIIPGLQVLRPYNITETIESWQIALESPGPSLLLLTRLSFKVEIDNFQQSNLSQKGGYRVLTSNEHPKFSIIASGSEVAIALDVAKKLSEENIISEVISLPCFELFQKQSDEYQKKEVRGDRVVVIEAASTSGWEKLLAKDVSFFNINSFGVSAKEQQIWDHFGYSADRISASLTALRNREVSK